ARAAGRLRVCGALPARRRRLRRTPRHDSTRAAPPGALLLSDSQGRGGGMNASATTPAPMIELRQVSKRFGERRVGAAGRLAQRLGLARPPAVTRAVDHVDLLVRPGEVV